MPLEAAGRMRLQNESKLIRKLGRCGLCVFTGGEMRRGVIGFRNFWFVCKL